MTGRVRLYLVGTAMLVALAGCGRGWMPFQEREPWRHQAEVECLKSNSVKIGTAVVQVSPIEGPGMCGADFPLKVASLGENSAISYADDLRPPGSIPNASSPGPRWPLSEPRYAPPAEPRYTPPPLREPTYVPPAQTRAAPTGTPLSINPPGVAPPPDDDDIPDDAQLPPARGQPGAPPMRPAYNAPTYSPPPRQAPPALGPLRKFAGQMPAATVTPAATLACPIVSALDQWVSAAVQPAAMRWFGQPVVEIKQISAYSCRGMNGNPNAHISEHAFGNALDIAAFVLTDGRKITVKNGWNGSPEEQGFLHDVQNAACQQFTTVLAPGSNVYHYDHIHVDLMRRASGRRICQPGAIDGEVVAARAIQRRLARQQGDPATTGSVGGRETAKRSAVPGQDDFWEDEEQAEETTKDVVDLPHPSRPAVTAHPHETKARADNW